MQETPRRSQRWDSRGMVRWLAAETNRALPGPYHHLRMLRHKLRVRQLQRVLQVVTAQQGLVVQSGPFQGLRYVPSIIESALAVPRALGSALVPKLLGCYEAELHGALAQMLETPYQKIIDIGSAEGYYAVGCAWRLPSAQVYAFESDPLRRTLCAELAQANGVAERVMIAGACTAAELARLAAGQPLIICDCEGYELELLQPALIPGLSRCDLLVELHDSANPLISKTILERFAPTHHLTLIQGRDNHPTDYPVLASLSPEDQRFAVSEERPAGMQWVFMQTKR